MSNLIVTIFVVSFAIIFGIASGNPLNATECKSKLLSPRSDVAVAYDGQDTIWIMGLYWSPDWNLLIYDEIHKFNISSDEIEVVSTRLPRTAHGGGAFYRQDRGDILYLRADGTFLWSINATTEQTVSENEWLGDSGGCTLSFLRDRVMAFGGLSNGMSVYTLYLGTLVQGISGTLPMKSEVSVGIYVPDEQATYMFAGELGSRTPQLMRYSHISNTTQVLDWIFPSFRHGDGFAIYSTVNSQIYLVGTVVDNGARGNGVIQIDTKSGNVTFIELEGVADELTATAAVYVEKLNRIYLVGGYDLRNKDRDEIWFIQL